MVDNRAETVCKDHRSAYGGLVGIWVLVVLGGVTDVLLLVSRCVEGRDSVGLRKAY